MSYTSCTATAANGSYAFGELYFSNKNNVSFSTTFQPGFNAIVASVTVASTQGSIVISAGTTNNSASAFSFSNGGNVSFGISASTITASVATSLTNMNISAGTTSQNLSNLVFSNSNGVTFGLNGSTITAAVTVSTSLTNINVSAGTTSNNLSAITFGNAGGVSFGLAGSVITANVTAAPAPVNFSAGTTSGNLGSVVFSNSNGVTFGLNGSTITASVGGGAESNNINLLGANTAGNTTVSGATLGFSGLNLTLSGTNNSQLVFSAPATSSIVGINGISISTAGSTISILPQWVSSYENLPGLINAQTMTWNGVSISHAVGFIVPENISASFLRLPMLMSQNATTIATLASASASASAGLTQTFNAVVYSIGTGASSRSLMSVASGSGSFQFTAQISVTASTQASYSAGFSGQAEGAGTNRTTQYSVSNTNYSFTTQQIATEFSGNRFLDIPFANSLTAGDYWLVVGMSSNTASAGAAGLAGITNYTMRYSNHYGVSQTNLTFGIMGSTNLTSGGLLMAGSFSTAGGGTTSAFPISAISSSSSHNRPYFQLLRSA
jgi:hypothetical protein